MHHSLDMSIAELFSSGLLLHIHTDSELAVHEDITVGMGQCDVMPTLDTLPRVSVACLVLAPPGERPQTQGA